MSGKKDVFALQALLPTLDWVSAPETLEGNAIGDYRPSLVAAPKSPAQVAQLLRTADEREYRIRIWYGTPNIGAFVPDHADTVILDMKKIDQVLEYDPDNLTVTVQLGCTLASLQSCLRESGQWLPLESPEPGKCYLGGILAANVSGPRRLLYGTARDLVLGMEMALVNGDIIRGGGRTMKNVAGYDLCRLFIGSMNTLGVMTTATFRLLPVPAETKSLLALFERSGDAFAFTRELCGGFLFPAAVEILDGLPQGVDFPVREGSILVATLLEGSGSVVDRQLQVTCEIARKHKCNSTCVLQNEQGRLLWSILARNGAPPSDGSEVCLRIGVPPTRLPEVWNLFGSMEASRQSRAGVGLLYVTMPTAHTSWLEECRKEVTAMEGYLVVSRGPQSLQSLSRVWREDDEEPRIMRALRDQFDPRRTLVGAFGTSK